MRKPRSSGTARGTVLRVLLAAAIGTALLHVAVLLPVFGARPGEYPILDGASDFAGAFLAGLMLWLRAGRERPGRRPLWRFVSGAVFAFLAATLLSVAGREGLPVPLWTAIVGYALFYVLSYAALVQLLRQRVHAFHPSMAIDGLISGLAVAAFTVAFLVTPVSEVVGSDPRRLLHALVLPVADLLLLAFLAGVLAVVWRTVGRDVALLAVGMVVFVTTDLVFALQQARGSYVDGGPVDLGWVLAQLCMALAACLPSRARGAARFPGAGVLLVPGISAAAAIGLLFLATWRPVELLAQRLAVLAVTVALARTVLTFREVSALADSRREARTDDLTGLPNLRGFLEELNRVAGPAGPLPGQTVLMVDVDRFKEINDLYGHAAGDRVIQAVGERLAAGIYPRDVVARVDGDAFAVLATELSPDEADGLARRLRSRVTRPVDIGAARYTPQVSIGVAVPADQVRTAAELLHMADLAMYAAKTRRAGVLRYDPGRDGRGRERARLIEELRQGIDRGELVLHYQPKVDLRTGRVSGVEALVRWAHPARGLLYPDAFVDLAETAGLMPAMTRAVLDKALVQVREWRRDGLRVTVAVNVSGSDLADETFPVLVQMVTDQHGVPPEALTLEVTEDVLIGDLRSAAMVLGLISATGVGVAIDDYGTGYSSLAYLADLPVDELKLDRALVASIAGDARARLIVGSTIDLAHGLGLTVTAEGIEDVETAHLLARLGCDTAQGYHFGRPVPADDVEILLRGDALFVPQPPGAPEAADAAERAGPARGMPGTPR